METIATFKHVTMKYGSKVALNDVSFDIPRGAVYALLGRNGMGKSSAIKCMLGHQKPTHGEISVFGLDSWKHRTRILERVGVVPEEPDAPPDMTPLQLAKFCAELYPTWDGAGVEARFARFKISLKARFKDLSKGQKAQVMMSLALGSQPELMVLDDPTLGLDVVARKEFFEELISELADRGITVLITTHDLAGIEPLADHIGILKDGRLAISDTVENLKARFRRIHCTHQTSLAANGLSDALEPLQLIRTKRFGWGMEAIVAKFDSAVLERFYHSQLTLVPEVVPMTLEEIFAAVVETEEGVPQ